MPVIKRPAIGEPNEPAIRLVSWNSPESLACSRANTNPIVIKPNKKTAKVDQKEFYNIQFCANKLALIFTYIKNSRSSY